MKSESTNNTSLLIYFVIDLFVSLEPLKIIPCLLHQRNSQYKSQWANIGEHEAHFQGWNELREADQKEEQIEEELELVEEDHWDKGKEVVLGVVYFVVQMRFRTVAYA